MVPKRRIMTSIKNHLHHTKNSLLVPRVSLIILLLILVNSNSYSQFFKRKLNAYNTNGQRTGLWLTYWDDEMKIPMSQVFYKNGYEDRVSKEFHQNGKLRLKFRHYSENRMRVKFYHENRKLESKGWAIMEYNKEDTHFYYHGKWKYYNQNRRLIKIGSYEYGSEVINTTTE